MPGPRFPLVVDDSGRDAGTRTGGQLDDHGVKLAVGDVFCELGHHGDAEDSNDKESEHGSGEQGGP